MSPNKPSIRRLPLAAALGGALLAGALSASVLDDEVAEFEPTGFGFEKELLLPGTPEEIYDAMTGDISAWWDHSFSDPPHALYIEPKPGGGFYEIFDEHGNGALHATVIYAQRGKALRFTGPLGLMQLGVPIEMVHSFTFEPVGDETRLELKVHASGELPEGIGAAVSGVWDHFLVERLLPYVKEGRERDR